jgi:hypothetical protein
LSERAKIRVRGKIIHASNPNYLITRTFFLQKLLQGQDKVKDLGGARLAFGKLELGSRVGTRTKEFRSAQSKTRLAFTLLLLKAAKEILIVQKFKVTQEVSQGHS